jgi:uncharacterized repeat protein (TIGR01451 family)
MKAKCTFNRLRIAIIIVLLMGSVQTSLFAQVSFSINKSGPVTVSPGDEISYTITYSNTGAQLAHNVIVKDYLPDANEYTYVSSYPEGNKVGNIITWSSLEIPDLESLGAGTRYITITIKAGKSGNSPSQYEEGYYMSNYTSVNLANYATIQSNEVSTPVQSNTVVTNVTTSCSFIMNEPGSGVKSATGSSLTYLMALTNTGNIYQKYTLTSAHVSGRNELIRSIATTSGTPLSETPFLSPGETFFFHYTVTTPAGTKPNEWNLTTITASPSLCGDPFTSYVNTFIYGGQYSNYELLGVYKIDNPDPVQAGEHLTYSIIITNQGSALSNVRLKETYPDYTTFVSANPAPTSGNNIWDFASLPAGNTYVTVTVNVDNDLADGTILSNLVEIGSPTKFYYDYTEHTTVRSAPDLKIIKSAIVVDPPAQLGSQVNYSIYYENNGNRTAPNVTINDIFNSNYIDIVDAGTGDTSIPGEITWTLGNLSPGDFGTINYTMKIKDNAALFPTGSTLITNNAAITSDLPDGNINDNYSSATVTIYNLPDLSVTKVASSNPGETGKELTYTITVTNLGPADHTDGIITITDLLPTGTTYKSSSPLGTYDNVLHKITWSFSDALNAGAERTYLVTLNELNCNLVENGLLNRVTVSSNKYTDANESNNTFTLATDVADIIPPEITCSVTETQNVDANVGSAYIHSGTGWDASATDNCEAVSLSAILTGDTQAGPYTSLNNVEFNEGTTLVTWTASDGSSNAVSCTFTVIVSAFADVVITKTASTMGIGDDEGKAIGIAGQELIYTLTVTNNGPSAARSVVITDDVSGFWSDAKYATTNSPYNWANWNPPYEYSIGTIANGASVTIYIKGTFALDQCEDITNVAAISWDNDENGDGASTSLYTIILDETNPQITTCPPNMTGVNALSGCDTDVIETETGLAYNETEVEITAQQFTNAGGVASDNCGVIYYGYIDSKTGSCPIVVTRKFIVKDASGNKDDCEQTIEIVAPVVALSVPADYDGTTCMTQDAVNTAFTNWLA